MTPLPAVVAEAVGATSWPSSPALRATLLRGLAAPARVALHTWAHAAAAEAAGAPPTVAQWAAVVGCSEQCVRELRSRGRRGVPALAALEVTARVAGRRPSPTASPKAVARRAQRAAQKAAQKKNRRRKTATA